ncbi:MAG: hypothetical protein SGILL_003678 [Bacillariaceae sp.]
MTQHNILPHPTALSQQRHAALDTLQTQEEPVANPIRKRRSQSFNDYIDQIDDLRYTSSQSHDADALAAGDTLILPSLKEQQDHAQQNDTSVLSTSPRISLGEAPVLERDPEDDSGYNICMTDMETPQSPPGVATTYQRAPSDASLHSKSQREAPKLNLSYRSTEEQQQQQLVADEPDGNPLYVSILYGAINCTIVIPVVMSFGNIIYRDDAFAPYMPVLIKLTLVSGFIHQICFSSLSTLKFAVGSVQDAGLIFLSSMAADMVAFCRSNGHDDEIMLATVTVGLGLAAALLGVGLVIIGKLGLASYVQMLPTCVVAGYLAYIGWFVGYSGLGIMVGVSAVTIPLLLDSILYVLPGIAGGILIYASVRRFRHVAVLPICITFLLLTFYIGLAIAGSSIEQATENGWIRKTEKAPVWYHTWDYLKLEKVAWAALPQLWLTWTGMLFVVALSSSLDVAAIELEMKRPLNYNKELGMVGISNFVSGMTGGYTGSYIFSQSIFSLRIGIRSRMAGFALAFFQLIIILVPFPVLSYIPNFFYGSLLSMICIDLMYEWLWEFRSKVTIAEYLIGLSTFALIHFLGVEYGILGGVVLYVICRQLSVDVGELKQIPTQDDQLLTEAALEVEAYDEKFGKSATDSRHVQSSEAESLLSNGAASSSYHAL